MRYYIIYYLKTQFSGFFKEWITIYFYCFSVFFDVLGKLFFVQDGKSLYCHLPNLHSTVQACILRPWSHPAQKGRFFFCNANNSPIWFDKAIIVFMWLANSNSRKYPVRFTKNQVSRNELIIYTLFW